MSVWSDGLLWEQEAAGSNPATRTIFSFARLAELVDALVLEASVERRASSSLAVGTNALIVKWYNASLVRMYYKFDSC